MADQTHEIELKFSLSADAGAALGADLFAGVDGQALVSTYFDTPGLDLLDADVAVRLRQTGRGWVQTLKAGSGAVRRFEDEQPVSSPRLDPSLFARRMLDKAAGGHVGELRPLFETRVHRRTRMVEHGSARIEAAYDEGEIVAGDRHEALNEFELELKSGRVSDLLAVAGRYVSAGVTLSLVSKAERGYRLAAGDSGSAVRFRQPALDFHGSAREGFQALALAALHQVSANVELLRRRASPEAVHQARVGLRRLKTFVGAFGSLVDDGQAGAVDAAIDRLTRLFETPRSLDVFQAGVFRGLSRQDAGAAEFGQALLAARARVYADLDAALAGRAVAEDLFHLVAWVVDGPWTRKAGQTPAEPRLDALAGDLLRHRWKRLRRRGRRLDWRDPRARHKLRIQAKKMRYLAEALLDPPAARRLLKRLERLQSELGVLNDIAMAPGTARLAFTPALSGDAAFAAGAMVGVRRSDLRMRRHRARKAFGRLVRKPADFTQIRRPRRP